MHRRLAVWNNRDYDYSLLFTLATASTEDLRAALDEHRAHRDTNLYDSAGGESSRDQKSDFIADPNRTGCKQMHK